MLPNDDNQQTNDQNSAMPGFTPPADLSLGSSMGAGADEPIATAPITPTSDDSTQSLDSTINDLATDTDPIGQTSDDSTQSVSEESAPSLPPADAPADDLLDIKKDALEQLSPLVEHLDQSPEEKFRTTMMMIQATDDHTKIKDAYAAAKEIEDKKAQAQAYLDIINEINYFTQQKNG